MKKRFLPIILSLIGFISLACMWDRDTISFEKENFPSTLEIITGNFIRHSPEFYQWRIKDRETKLKSNPKQWNYYDDLAVAYDKLGNHTKAIALMQKKDKLYPNQYETYANLGTFYIHNKEYKKGLKYIDKAIYINPDAHFGREIYQKYLVEYLLSKIKNGRFTLPLNPYAQNHYYQSGFYYYLKKRQKEKFNIHKARLGLMGMVKFGKHNSPILMEALGDLLAGENKNIPNNAPYLAYLAYKRAGMCVKNVAAQQLYNKKNPPKNQWFKLKYYMPQKIALQKVIGRLDKSFTQEIKEAQKLAFQIRNDEINWIATATDPEAKFDEKYLKKDNIAKYINGARQGLFMMENRRKNLNKELDTIANKDSVLKPETIRQTVPQKNATNNNSLSLITFIAIGCVALILVVRRFIRKS
ncbi:hypothetical protein BKI52_41380 [marine bacterium AO1-C]|nr:hypothetical protein BKI52_41380 [marine bacterium AO1-C]